VSGWSPPYFVVFFAACSGFNALFMLYKCTGCTGRSGNIFLLRANSDNLSAHVYIHQLVIVLITWQPIMVTEQMAIFRLFTNGNWIMLVHMEYFSIRMSRCIHFSDMWRNKTCSTVKISTNQKTAKTRKRHYIAQILTDFVFTSHRVLPNIDVPLILFRNPSINKRIRAMLWID
jgi:hypothetical protein